MAVVSPDTIQGIGDESQSGAEFPSKADDSRMVGRGIGQWWNRRRIPTSTGTHLFLRHLGVG